MFYLHSSISNTERIETLRQDLENIRNKINDIFVEINHTDLTPEMHQRYKVLYIQREYFEKELAYRETETH